jgi:hypothetical protein
MFKHHTPFPQAMPDEHKVEGDAVAAYRKYINCEKGYAVWNFSEKPSWWSEELHKPCRDEYLKQRELKKQLKAKDDPQPPSVPSALQSEREV